jgi:hypothetical protein
MEKVCPPLAPPGDVNTVLALWQASLAPTAVGLLALNEVETLMTLSSASAGHHQHCGLALMHRRGSVGIGSNSAGLSLYRRRYDPAFRRHNHDTFAGHHAKARHPLAIDLAFFGFNVVRIQDKLFEVVQAANSVIE